MGSSPAGGKGREVAFCRQVWQEAHITPHQALGPSHLASPEQPRVLPSSPNTGLRPSCDSWLWSHRGETRPGQPGTPQLDFPCWCWHNWLAGTGKDEGQSPASTAPGLTVWLRVLSWAKTMSATGETQVSTAQREIII